MRRDLEEALERNTDWSLIHAIGDLNAAHKFLVGSIIAALDQVAQLQSISVRRGENTYLAADTLALMQVPYKTKGAVYKTARNRVS